MVSGGWLRESAMAWTQANTVLSSMLIWSSTKSSGDFASIVHGERSSAGNCLRFAVTMT